MGGNWKTAAMKAHWHNIGNALAAVMLLAVSSFLALFFGAIWLFYILTCLGFAAFLCFERKPSLREPRHRIYQRMLRDD